MQRLLNNEVQVRPLLDFTQNKNTALVYNTNRVSTNILGLVGGMCPLHYSDPGCLLPSLENSNLADQYPVVLPRVQQRPPDFDIHI